MALHHVSSLPKQFWQKHGEIQGNRSNMLIKLNEQLCCSKLNDHNGTSDWVLIHVKTKTSPSFAQSKPWNFLFRIINDTTLYHIHHIISNPPHHQLHAQPTSSGQLCSTKKTAPKSCFLCIFHFFSKRSTSWLGQSHLLN